MTVNGTAKASGRSRTRKSTSSSPDSAQPTAEAKATPTETSVETNRSEAAKEETMATSDNVVNISARPVPEEASQKEGAIQLRQSALSSRPVMPSDIHIADTITVAGVRPIAVSDLQVCGSYLNGRPISCSELKVAEMLPGDRPVFVSDFHAVDDLMFLGDRPVMSSDPSLMEASMLPGNRPIASNEIDDPASLMGFID